MPEFTVGQRVRNDGRTATVVAMFDPGWSGHDMVVRDRNNGLFMAISSNWSPIPDTVMVELSREDAETAIGICTAVANTHVIRNLTTSALERIIDSCRTALGAE